MSPLTLSRSAPGSSYGHFAAECKKPKQDREAKEAALIAQVPDEDSVLLTYYT